MDSGSMVLMSDVRSLERLDEEGREFTRHNPRLAQFASMLVHPEFASFWDENFGDWVDCQQSIMLLKTGSFLRNELQARTGQPATGFQVAAALKKALDRPDSRQYMVTCLMTFMGSGSSSENEPKTQIMQPPRKYKRLTPRRLAHKPTPNNLLLPSMSTSTRVEDKPRERSESPVTTPRMRSPSESPSESPCDTPSSWGSFSFGENKNLVFKSRSLTPPPKAFPRHDAKLAETINPVQNAMKQEALRRKRAKNKFQIMRTTTFPKLATKGKKSFRSAKTPSPCVHKNTGILPFLKRDDVLKALALSAENPCGWTALELFQHLKKTRQCGKTDVNRFLYQLLDLEYAQKTKHTPPRWDLVCVPEPSDEKEAGSCPDNQLELRTMDRVIIDVANVPDVLPEIVKYMDSYNIMVVCQTGFNLQPHMEKCYNHLARDMFEFSDDLTHLEDKNKVEIYRSSQENRKSEAVIITILAYELMKSRARPETLYICSKNKNLRELANVGQQNGVNVIFAEKWNKDLALHIE